MDLNFYLVMLHEMVELLKNLLSYLIKTIFSNAFLRSIIFFYFFKRFSNNI